jgi:hypothetical protein
VTEEKTEPRCERCSNYLRVCGHNLPFKDRIRDIQIDKTSLRVR